MTNTPSPEDRELIDYLRRCCEQSYGPSAPTMLPAVMLLKAADRLESLLQWQLAETAPRDGTKILGRNNRGNMAVVLWQEWAGKGGWVCMFSDARPHPFWNGGCGSVMTHWMALPDQPGDQGAQ